MIIIIIDVERWHMATNLEETLAITSNYVSESNLAYCLHFIDKDNNSIKNGQEVEERVSGIDRSIRKELYNKFVDALQKLDPELLSRAQRERKALYNNAMRKRRKTDDCCNENVVLLQANNNDSSMNEKKQDGKETTFKFNFDL